MGWIAYAWLKTFGVLQHSTKVDPYSSSVSCQYVLTSL
jgi:hypothetical protein